MLELHRGVLPSGDLLLRVHFPFMGSTSWRGWDGTEEGAVGAIDEEAYLKAQDLAHDQTHGPTGWETEFDR